MHRCVIIVWFIISIATPDLGDHQRVTLASICHSATRHTAPMAPARISVRHVGRALRQGSTASRRRSSERIDRRRIFSGLRASATRARRTLQGRCPCVPVCLDLREDWIGTVPREIDQHVKPLRHGKRETGATHRPYRMAVDGDMVPRAHRDRSRTASPTRH